MARRGATVERSLVSVVCTFTRKLIWETAILIFFLVMAAFIDYSFYQPHLMYKSTQPKDTLTGSQEEMTMW